MVGHCSVLSHIGRKVALSSRAIPPTLTEFARLTYTQRRTHRARGAWVHSSRCIGHSHCAPAAVHLLAKREWQPLERRSSEERIFFWFFLCCSSSSGEVSSGEGRMRSMLRLCARAWWHIIVDKWQWVRFQFSGLRINRMLFIIFVKGGRILMRFAMFSNAKFDFFFLNKNVRLILNEKLIFV